MSFTAKLLLLILHTFAVFKDTYVTNYKNFKKKSRDTALTAHLRILMAYTILKT